jgi:hypothetical protein
MGKGRDGIVIYDLPKDGKTNPVIGRSAGKD